MRSGQVGQRLVPRKPLNLISKHRECVGLRFQHLFFFNDFDDFWDGNKLNSILHHYINNPDAQ